MNLKLILATAMTAFALTACGEKAAETTNNAAEATKGVAAQAADATKEAAGNAVEAAKGAATDAVNAAAGKAAEGVEAAADAVRPNGQQ